MSTIVLLMKDLVTKACFLPQLVLVDSRHDSLHVITSTHFMYNPVDAASTLVVDGTIKKRAWAHSAQN